MTEPQDWFPAPEAALSPDGPLTPLGAGSVVRLTALDPVSGMAGALIIRGARPPTPVAWKTRQSYSSCKRLATA